MMHRVQRELGHLVIGKAVSTLMGLAVLLMLWRRVAPTAYGQYLSVVAAAEILSLVSALGLSTVAQRHLPIWMAHAASAGHALWRIAQVLLIRNLLSVLFLAAFLAMAASRPDPWSAGALLTQHPLSLGLIVVTVFIRSLEEVQVVLLMQAWLQGLAVAAHLLRLLALSTLETGELADFAWLVRMELVIACSVLLVGLAAASVRTLRGLHLDDALKGERPYPWMAAWRNSLQFWLTQCLGLAWSIHTLRLLLQSVAGPKAVAVQGVAQAMADSLRQATPMVWATGWLRAAMLRLHTSQPHSNRALVLACAVHRISMLMLWPVVAAWCVEPAAWIRWAGGSEMFIKAQELSSQHPGIPSITGLLAATAVLAPLQNRHLLISLWAYVQQRPGWGVLASLMAVFPVAAFGWLWSLVGLWCVPLVMLTAEFLWVVTASRAWASERCTREASWRFIQIPLAAFTAAALLGLVLSDTTGPQSALRLALPLLAAALAVCVLAWRQGIWPPEEKAALRGCLPSMPPAWKAAFRGHAPR